MQLDLSRPQPKLSRESPRSVLPGRTVALAEAALRRVGIGLDISTQLHGDVFWTATADMSFRERLPPNARGLRIAGKGRSEEQCRASCAMELVERYSLFDYTAQELSEHCCVDLADGAPRIVNRLPDLLDTRCVAAGNTYEEAVLHALEELVETRIGRTLPWIPLQLVGVEALLPELPEWVGRDFVLVRAPTPAPELHHLTALRYPADGQFDLQISDHFVKAGGRLLRVPGARPKNHHSPNSGGAASLDPRIAAFRAMNEAFQGGPGQVGVGKRRAPPDFVAVAPPTRLHSAATDCVAADVRRMLQLLGEEVFVGVVDLTHPRLQIPVVRLVSDYDPGVSLTSRHTLRMFFDLDD